MATRQLPRLSRIFASPYILAHVTPSTLVPYLIESEVLSIQEGEAVQATDGGMTEQTRKIFSIVEKTFSSVLSFVQCLRKSNHGCVADLVEVKDPGSANPVNTAFVEMLRFRLQKNYLGVASNIVLSELLPHMITNGVLSIATVDMITGGNIGEITQVMKLIAVVDRLPDDKFLVFVECLRHSGHDHVAHMLEGGADDATINIEYREHKAAAVEGLPDANNTEDDVATRTYEHCHRPIPPTDNVSRFYSSVPHHVSALVGMAVGLVLMFVIMRIR